MNNEPRTFVLVPPGRYILGDPCYSISNEKWGDWLDAAGLDLVNDHPEHILAAEFNGHIAFGVGTAHGDGEYEDQFGNSFGVDSGMIGLVHVDSADDVAAAEVHVIEITEETVVYVRDGDGQIEIGEHQIETDAWHCEDCGVKIEHGGYVCQDCGDERERQDVDENDEDGEYDDE